MGPSSVITRVRDLAGRRRPPVERSADEQQAPYVCHCKHVEYREVDRAIRRGARTIADLQRKTSACTRCFGCRFELEQMLRTAYGDAYTHEATITLPPGAGKTRIPRPMHMPVLAGFGGYDIDTRVIVFNWESAGAAVPFRVDLLKLDGERVRVWQRSVADGHSAIVDLSREVIGDALPDGVGVVKLVLETEAVGSLRPYFHFVTPTSITTTHEKKGPNRPEKQENRHYNWIFPIGAFDRPEEAYFFCTNTQTTPMLGQRLVWQTNGGAVAETPMPDLEFGQSAMVPLHERFPTLNSGEGGTVRLEPATHTVAGFMMRHEPEAQRWRVQHL